MALTPAQKTTLKAHIAASSDLNIYPNNTDGNVEVTRLLNLAASPAFTVWKNAVTIGDVGKAFNATELAGLTQLNHVRLQTLAIYLAGGVAPFLASIRAFFDDIFSGAGGTNTRAALLVLWKRLASRVEQLFATGTGSDAVPATLGFEGPISVNDVEAARTS
jgi:hypothetical protein